MKAKRVIKKVAKTTGKYTLKGIGKGIELTGRGAAKTINALVKSPNLQKIATGTGVLLISVTCSPVGVGLIGVVGLKYMIDKGLLGKRKANLLSEFNDIVNVGNVLTKTVCNSILSPVLRTADRGINNVGNMYQDKIDDIFR